MVGVRDGVMEAGSDSVGVVDGVLDGVSELVGVALKLLLTDCVAVTERVGDIVGVREGVTEAEPPATGLLPVQAPDRPT